MRAILIRTEAPGGVGRARTSPGEDHHRRWRTRGLGTRIEPLLTGLSHGGLLMCPVNDLGSLAHLRTGLAGFSGIWDAGLRGAGHQI